MELLAKYKKRVVLVDEKDYKYVLSNGKTRELLFVAQ